MRPAAKKLPGTSLEPIGPVAFWSYASGWRASSSAPNCPHLHARAQSCRKLLAVLAGYLLRCIVATYRQSERPNRDRDLLTPRGLQMLDWSRHSYLLHGGVDHAFHHLECARSVRQSSPS